MGRKDKKKKKKRPFRRLFGHTRGHLPRKRKGQPEQEAYRVGRAQPPSCSAKKKNFSMHLGGRSQVATKNPVTTEVLQENGREKSLERGELNKKKDLKQKGKDLAVLRGQTTRRR